jgi:hypothetical protein
MDNPETQATIDTKDTWRRQINSTKQKTKKDEQHGPQKKCCCEHEDEQTLWLKIGGKM